MSAQRQHEQRQAEGELNDSVEQTVEERAEALAHDMVDEWRARSTSSTRRTTEKNCY